MIRCVAVDDVAVDGGPLRGNEDVIDARLKWSELTCPVRPAELPERIAPRLRHRGVIRTQRDLVEVATDNHGRASPPLPLFAQGRNLCRAMAFGPADLLRARRKRRSQMNGGQAESLAVRDRFDHHARLATAAGVLDDATVLEWKS